MKIRAYSLVLALLGASMLSTVAVASFSDVREWTAFNKSFTDPDGNIAATSFDLNPTPHGYTVTARTSSLKWSGQFTSAPANAGQVDEYSVTLTVKEGATTRLACDGVSFSRVEIDLGRFQSTFISYCQSTGTDALVPGTTYTYQTDVVMVSGSNHLSQVGYSFQIVQTDSVTDSTLDDLPTNTEALAQHQQTRSLINTTHVHLDSHFNQTNALVFARTFYTNELINDSRELILAEISGVCSTPESCNITVEPFSVVELPGFSDEEVGALLLFIAMLLFAFFQRWLFVAIASVIGIIDLMFRGPLGPEPVIGFAGTLLLLILGIVLQVMMDIRDSHLERKEEVDR